MAFSPDGKSLYVAGGADHAVSHFERDAAGKLTFRGCVADSGAGGLNCTVPPKPVLAGPTNVAVSPDGRWVYVLAETDNAVSTFERLANGSLQFEGCWADNGLAGCLTPPVDAFNTLSGLAVSPVGQSVYVASVVQGAITQFEQQPSGELAYRSCWSSDAIAGCTPVGQLAGAFQLAVSPDGRSLYSASFISTGVLAHLSRAATGGLTFDACFSSESNFGCTVPNPAPLRALSDVVVSPDGTSVYTTSSNDHAISHFARATDGLLTFGGCVSDAVINGCSTPARPALQRPFGLAVSPDSNSVYATSTTESAVTHFARGASGTLTFQSCLADAGAAGCDVLPTLAAALGAAVSPDGLSTYVAGQNDSAISHFRREPPGGDPPTSTPDTAAPDTAAGKGPKRKVKTRKRRARVSFEFSSPEPATTFECSLDSAAPNPCASPATTKVKAKRKAKRHSFEVAAIDAAGNTDPTPIVFNFKVKRKP